MDYPILDVNGSFISFWKPLEILSISGNVTLVKGEPLVQAHLHPLLWPRGRDQRHRGPHYLGILGLLVLGVRYNGDGGGILFREGNRRGKVHASRQENQTV